VWQCEDRDEIICGDRIVEALERLQARAAAGVPDLDGPVVRRRRQPGRVVREGHGVDRTAMALERLHARAAADVQISLTPKYCRPLLSIP
jgi:hypothetical protein